MTNAMPWTYGRAISAAPAAAAMTTSSVSRRRARMERMLHCRVGQDRLGSGPFGPSCPMRPLIIAIDGPSGAGKGTVARAVAGELGYRHIDSGAMYRAVGWKALRDAIPFDNEAEITALAERSRIEISSTRVAIDGADVTRAIRTP